MKTKLINEFKSIEINSLSCQNLYIMDFEERSYSTRGIEVSESNFFNDPDMLKHESIPLCVENPTLRELHFAKLGSNIFPNSVKNAEGSLFSNNPNSFVLIVEIKDCKCKNLPNHSQKAKQQILDTVNEFRNRRIIHERQKVYAVISVPRRTKTSFDSSLFCHQDLTKAIFKKFKVIIAGTNQVKVIDEERILHILPE